MQHVRGLVRAVSRGALRRLEHAVGNTTAAAGAGEGKVSSMEAATSCLVQVRLVDSRGAHTHATLLQSLRLMQAAWHMPRDDALRCVSAIQERLCVAYDNNDDKHASSSLSSSSLPLLYVKDSVRAVHDELMRRQRRHLAYVHGRLLAHDLDAVTAFVQSLQQQQQEETQQQQQTHKEGSVYTTEQMVTYNGVVEELCVRAYTTAIALAIDSRMPPLQSRTAHRLASAVDVHSRDAVCCFLDGFAVRDEAVPASETCATQLALRLRSALAECDTTQQQQQQHVMNDGSSNSSSSAHVAQLRALLRECEHYNIDPSIVYSHEAARVQQWATHCLLRTNTNDDGDVDGVLLALSSPQHTQQTRLQLPPHERTAALLHMVRSRQLLPRRVSIDALGVWCMSDVARPWLAHALGTSSSSTSNGSSSSADDKDVEATAHSTPCEDDGGGSDSGDKGSNGLALSVVARRDATAFALRDVRRNLVDTGLLHHYADLLARGDIAVVSTASSSSNSNDDVNDSDTHNAAARQTAATATAVPDSFAAFLEQCGECHDAQARPRRLSFTMPAPRRGQSVAAALRALAPYCAYWCTLLDHMGDEAVRVCVAPFGELHVDVTLPAAHECVRVAHDLVAAVAQARSVTRNDDNDDNDDDDDDAVTSARLLASALTSASSSHSHASCVLYSDDDVLVLNKPAGVPTTRHALSCTQLGRAVTDVVSVLLACDAYNNKTHDSTDSHRVALTTLPRQGLVHRLDKGTSGCLVVARSVCAADSLRHQMGTSAAFTYSNSSTSNNNAEHTAASAPAAAVLSSHDSKVYTALCVVVEPSLSAVPLHGTLSDPLDSKVVTRYRIVRFARAARLALVQCRLTQGKKHQVRRHLAAAGLPLVGDVEHGGFVCARPLLRRPALHASSVAFVHPTRSSSVGVVRVSAPLPRDMRAAVAALD